MDLQNLHCAMHVDVDMETILQRSVVREKRLHQELKLCHAESPIMVLPVMLYNYYPSLPLCHSLSRCTGKRCMMHNYSMVYMWLIPLV